MPSKSGWGPVRAILNAMDKLQKQLDKLQEAAQGMADKSSPGSEAERQKMAESLSALLEASAADGDATAAVG